MHFWHLTLSLDIMDRQLALTTCLDIRFALLGSAAGSIHQFASKQQRQTDPGGTVLGKNLHCPAGTLQTCWKFMCSVPNTIHLKLSLLKDKTEVKECNVVLYINKSQTDAEIFINKYLAQQ